LGPVGDKVEEWTLKGAYIQTAKFSDMDYTGEDLATVDLTLTYDYAKQVWSRKRGTVNFRPQTIAEIR